VPQEGAPPGMMIGLLLARAGLPQKAAFAKPVAGSPALA